MLDVSERMESCDDISRESLGGSFAIRLWHHYRRGAGPCRCAGAHSRFSLQSSVSTSRARFDRRGLVETLAKLPRYRVSRRWSWLRSRRQHGQWRRVAVACDPRRCRYALVDVSRRVYEHAHVQAGRRAGRPVVRGAPGRCLHRPRSADPVGRRSVRHDLAGAREIGPSQLQLPLSRGGGAVAGESRARLAQSSRRGLPAQLSRV